LPRLVKRPAPAEHLLFPAIARKRVANEAIDRIKSMIVRGELHAYDRLPPERDLADLLGVSRPTLREAIRALIAMQILESRHGEGTFVTSLDPELLAEPIDFLLRLDEHSIVDLFEARQVLEPRLARLAAERASGDDLQALDRLSREYYLNLGDFDACSRIDMEFHQRVARAARNPILAALLVSIRALGQESRSRTGHSKATRQIAAADHETISAAVSQGDAERAERAMAEHLEHMLRSLANRPTA
jgi:GntR family transcriptional repressor for pyruvate dehydrogenase complex